MKLVSSILAGAAGLAAAAGPPGTWSSPHPNLGAIGTAIEFSSNDDGFFGVGGNSGGGAMLETTDGSRTWDAKALPGGNETLWVFLGSAQAKDSVMFGSLGSSVITRDSGKTWEKTEPPVIANQFLGSGPGSIYLAPGDGTTAGLSTDDGATWTTIPVTSTNVTDVRYAAVPAEDAMYISCGQWPENSASSKIALTSRVALDTDTGATSFTFPAYEPNVSLRGALTDDTPAGSFAGQITKSADGGKTWKTQFDADGGFYFNDLACKDGNNCCAAGEGGFSPNAGIFIVCTNDGENWDLRFSNTTSAGLSAMGAAWVPGTDEVWIGGGLMGEVGPAHALAWYSDDAGKTFTQQETGVQGQYIAAMSFPSSDRGYAASLNIVDESGQLMYAA